MWIRPKLSKKIPWLQRQEQAREICNELRLRIMEWLERSRFTASVSVEPHRDGWFGIKIETVRKRRRTHYCGQHPYSCQIQPVRRKEFRSAFLEGADWVGFNDGLNDLLDSLEFDADVWSHNRESRGSKYMLRRGRERRVDYLGEELNSYGRPFFLWAEDGEFADYCGRDDAPRSEYAEGTPGIADWRPEAEQGESHEHEHDRDDGPGQPGGGPDGCVPAGGVDRAAEPALEPSA